MNIFITILATTLFGCSPSTIKMADDVIEGEAKVIEQAISDMLPPGPTGPTQP